MPTRAVVSSLIVAVVLALGVAASLLLDRRATGEPVGEALLALKPSTVDRIEVFRADGSHDVIERDGRAWRLVLGDEDAVVWPVDEGRVAAAVRLLAQSVRSTGRAFEHTPDEPGAQRLVIHWRDGTTTLECQPAGVGGAVAIGVRADGGATIAATADRSVTGLFSRAGLAAWRTPRAMPAMDSQASGVTIRSGSMVVELARRGERWVMLKPIATRADAQRVGGLLSHLGSMGVGRFYDAMTADSPETGLDEPVASVRVEAGPSGERIVSSIELGKVADLDAKTIFALARTGRDDGKAGAARLVFGPAVVSLAVEEVNGISPVPDAYVDRRAMGISPADVRRVVVERPGHDAMVFARTLGNWAGESGAQVDPGDGAMLERVVGWLTSERSASASIAVPAEPNEIAAIEVFGLDGGSLGRVVVGRANPVLDQPNTTTMLISDGAARWYPDAAWQDVLAWLMAL